MRLLFAFTCMLTAGVVIQAQSQPDFSGQWTISASSITAHDGQQLPRISMEILQTPAELRLDTRNSQEGSIPRELLVYKFDGSENSTEGSTGGPVLTKAHWDGPRLITESTRTINGAPVKSIHTLSLDASGRELTVEKTLMVQHGYRSQTPRNTGTGKEVYVRAAAQSVAAGEFGIFEGHGDVGKVVRPGTLKHDSASGAYAITGAGENIWGTADALHFAWKKMSGDVMLTANIQINAQPGDGGDPHRKAVLMIRQSLDADSAYADAALHSDGLTSLQYRVEKGGRTQEVQSSVSGPVRLRLTRRGSDVYLSVAGPGEELKFAGGSVRLPLQEPFYVGLGVSAHHLERSESAVFSGVDLKPAPPMAEAKPVLHSTLETIAVSSTDRRVVYTAPTHFEAPNWTPNGKELIFNSGGRLQRIAASGGKPELIETGFATRCNNDHGISPDAKQIVISDGSQQDRKSRIYTLPITGGTPKLITKDAPSYWHGWSPDGKTLTYCGRRNGEFDIYTIPVEGGEETRLTTAKGLDDGPEYSPDGQHIYFNSERTGRMQIWRMRSDGSQQEQVTADDFNNWFAHISPDGKMMAFLTYGSDVTGHPANKDVQLRLMTLADKQIRVLAKLFGGQGTINVPSWSPDSKRFAFVSYQLLPEAQ